jgi:hypothetical protein
MWETSSTTDIAEATNATPIQVQYIANQIRKAGYPLIKKYQSGMIRKLIGDVIKDRKFKSRY